MFDLDDVVISFKKGQKCLISVSLNNYIGRYKSFSPIIRKTCEFPSKIIIVAWGHLYDYVENFRTPRIVHREIFGFLFHHYQLFSQ